jgi:hypothetical protein
MVGGAGERPAKAPSPALCVLPDVPAVVSRRPPCLGMLGLDHGVSHLV